MTKFRHYFSFLTLISAVSIGSASYGFSQVTGDDGARSMTSMRFTQLMRQSDGLLKVTDAIGDYTFTESDPDSWGSYDLLSLKNISDLVITAVVEGSEGQLALGGGSVDTLYKVRILSTVRGNQTGSISFKSTGGRVTLSNGHSVTLHTTAWDNLKVGDEYVLFLKKDPTEFRLASGVNVNGVLRMDPQTRKTSTIIAAKSQTTTVRSLNGVDIAEVEQRVRDAK